MSYSWSILSKHNDRINQHQGCPNCIGRNRTLDQMIDKANEIHHNKYDYSLIHQYKTINDLVRILCPIYKEFNQRWSRHIHTKQGCPKCAYDNHRGRYQYQTTEALSLVPAQFYVLRLSDEIESFIKVGVTKNNWKIGIGVKSYKQYNIVELCTIESTMDICLQLETNCISQLTKLQTNYRPNRPKFEGHTECFKDTLTTLHTITKVIEKEVK